MDALLMERIGYHGTNSDNVPNIINDGFFESTSPFEWLGHGVYFFVEGIGCPVTNAIHWARNSSYSAGRHTYQRYSVIQATAVFSNILDATTVDGINAFNKLSEQVVKKYDTYFEKNRDLKEDKCNLWNLVSDLMGAEVVIHNLYIKNREQRIINLCGNVPNTTVMCVRNIKNIDQTSLKVVNTGSVIESK